MNLLKKKKVKIPEKSFRNFPVKKFDKSNLHHMGIHVRKNVWISNDLAVYYDVRHTSREIPEWLRQSRGVFADTLKKKSHLETHSEGLSDDDKKAKMKRKGKEPTERRKKQKHDPIRTPRGIEIREEGLIDSEDSDSDESDLNMFHQEGVGETSTQTNVRLTKLESDLKEMKDLLLQALKKNEENLGKDPNKSSSGKRSPSPPVVVVSDPKSVSPNPKSDQPLPSVGIDDVPKQDPPPSPVVGSHPSTHAVPDPSTLGLSSDPSQNLQEQGAAEALTDLQTTTLPASTASKQKLHPRLKTLAHKKCSSSSRKRKAGSSSTQVSSLEHSDVPPSVAPETDPSAARSEDPSVAVSKKDDIEAKFD